MELTTKMDRRRMFKHDFVVCASLAFSAFLVSSSYLLPRTTGSEQANGCFNDHSKAGRKFVGPVLRVHIVSLDRYSEDRMKVFLDVKTITTHHPSSSSSAACCSQVKNGASKFSPAWVASQPFLLIELFIVRVHQIETGTSEQAG